MIDMEEVVVAVVEEEGEEEVIWEAMEEDLDPMDHVVQGISRVQDLTVMDMVAGDTEWGMEEEWAWEWVEEWEEEWEETWQEKVVT